MSNPSPHPDPLYAYLAEHDVTCPTCGYNLRGATSARCPECGGEFTLAQLAGAAEIRALRRACWAGFAYSLVAIGAVMVMILFLARRDPQNILALALPALFFIAWLGLVTIWLAVSRRPRFRSMGAAQLFTGLSWSVGTLLLMLMFALALAGP